MKPIILIHMFALAAAIAYAVPSEAKDHGEAKSAVAKVSGIPNLTGTKWKLKSCADKTINPKKSDVTMSFHVSDNNGKSYISWSFGTKGFSAYYQAKADGRFSVGTIGRTEREKETPFDVLLTQVHKHAMVGKNLVLSNKEGKEILVFGMD